MLKKSFKTYSKYISEHKQDIYLFAALSLVSLFALSLALHANSAFATSFNASTVTNSGNTAWCIVVAIIDSGYVDALLVGGMIYGFFELFKGAHWLGLVAIVAAIIIHELPTIATTLFGITTTCS